jgi:hypothetical protein
MKYRVNLTGMNLSTYLDNPVVTLNYGNRLEDVVGKVVELDERHAIVKFLPGRCPRYKHALVSGHVENMVANSEHPVGYKELVELTVVPREWVQR